MWTAREQLPSDTRVGAALIERLLERLAAAGWSEHERFSVHLALEEALANAIKHGNGHDPSKQVHFEARLAPDRLWLEVADEGNGFDPATLPDPTDAEHIDRPNGRGVLLIRSFMTHVEYQDGGRRIVMEKHREPPPN